MSTTTYGWLVLAFPLAGAIVNGLGYKKLGRGAAGWIGTLAIGLAFVSAVARCISLQGHASDHRQLVSSLWDYAVDGRHRREAVDPRRPAVGLHDPRRDGRLDADPPLQRQLHEERPRQRALLRVPQLLRLLDARAGARRQLPAADRRLGVRRRRLVPADLLLVPPRHGDEGRHQGVRDQRSRRRRARARDVLHPPPQRRRSTSSARSRRSTTAPSPATTAALVAGCLLLLVGAFAKSAQIPLHTWLPDAMEGPTPVSSLIHAATMVTAGVYLIARMHPLFEHAQAAADVGAIVGCVTLLVAGTIGARDDRHQARDRVLDDVADRLHDHGRLRRRLRGRPLPPDDARLLQGAAVHGRRLDHRRDGRHAVARQDERLPQGDAVHVRLLRRRRARAERHPAVLRLLLEGRDPRDDRRARRLVRRALCRRLRRRVPDRRLHVADDLPRLLGRAVRRGARAGARPPRARRAADEPGERRGRGQRSRLPRSRARDRRAGAADEGRDGRARRAARRSAG